MIAIVAPLLFLIYLLSMARFGEGKYDRVIAIILRLTILITSLLLITLLVAERYNIYPANYWTIKIIFWLLVFSCMAASGLCKSKHFFIIERVIYKIIFFLPLALLAFLFIPFLGMGVGLLFYVKFIGEKDFILYSDNAIRIEQPFIRFMGPNPKPILYSKNAFTCSKDTTLPNEYDDLKDKIEVIKNDTSSYTIILKSRDNWQVPTGTDTFYYSLTKEPNRK